MPDYQDFYQQDELTALRRRVREDQRLWSHIVWHRRRRRLVRHAKVLLMTIAFALISYAVWYHLV